MAEKDNSKAIQNFQIIEQNLQNTLMQKQAFQMELNETISAIKELKESGDEVFKIIGQLLIKSDKKKIEKNLESKKNLVELRIKTLEKQEQTLTEKLEDIRKNLK